MRKALPSLMGLRSYWGGGSAHCWGGRGLEAAKGGGGSPVDPHFGFIFCTYLFLPHGRFLEVHVSSLERSLGSGSCPVSGSGRFWKRQSASDRCVRRFWGQFWGRWGEGSLRKKPLRKEKEKGFTKELRMRGVGFLFLGFKGFKWELKKMCEIEIVNR